MTILGRARRYRRRAIKAVEASSHAAWRKRPIRSGTVLYESFAGNGMLCNPEAIFRRLLSDQEFADFEHIWVLSDLHEYRATVEEFRETPNVHFVRQGSGAYYKALATSQYLINNATFPPPFSKRPGQIYLNTWHGTPLKRMGYDMPNGAADSANTLRNFVAADFLLAANDFMATTMYESAYRLAGIYRGRIIEEGYPRIDRQVMDAAGEASARRRLEHAGLPIGDRTVVVYAPTWKGETFNRPQDDIDTLVQAVADMQRGLGDDHIVVLKTHQIVHRFARSNPQLKRILVPNEIPTNVVLGVAGALVTDYSSIFFDYLATGRPIAFYAPDMSDYSDGRGVYLPPAEWPGPVHTTAAEVAASLRELLASGAPHERYRQWQQRFTPNEDGAATDRVIDIVFRGGTEGRRVREAAQDDRTKILLYLGGMRSNGITASALNLLRNIDHGRYDVSVLIAASSRAQQRANQDKIHPAVRQFPRVGGMNGSKLEHLKRRVAGRRGAVELHRTDAAQAAMWDEEWTRCFGDLRFDDVIDFSGYSPFWSTVLLHSPPATRSIWLHNDMSAEVHREVNGKQSMRRSLPAVFGLYTDFDHLVSVSPRLNELNRRQLAAYAPSERFTAVRNLTDADRVIRESKVDVRDLPDHPIDPDAPPVEEGEEPVRIMPDWATQITTTHDATAPDTVWFVTVGRLSPEKNQERLLRAFAAVHHEHPETRLLIVGQGPLREQLERTIDALGLGGVAFLTGAYHNPFAIMAASDCFVLSSNYEGQPMVLLEAAVVGLPIVSVDFTSVHDALPNDSIRIVAQTDDGLADGMRAYLRGEVPSSTIDLAAYTRDVLDEFEIVIKPLPARQRD